MTFSKECNEKGINPSSFYSYKRKHPNIQTVDQYIRADKSQKTPNERLSDLGIDVTAELRAFNHLQSIDNLVFKDNATEMKNIYEDKKRGKWVARYKTDVKNSDIVKPFFGRFDNKEDACKAMYQHKLNMIVKLKEKYPDFYIRNVYKRKIEKGKGTKKIKYYNQNFESMTDEEIYDMLIKC